MSKKEKPQLEATDFVDSTKFGYDEGVNVEIPGQLLYAVMRVIGTLANEEVKWMFQINPASLAETAQESNMVNCISNEGVTYFNILGELESVHMKNIKEGKTLPIEEVQEKIQAKIKAVMEKTAEESSNLHLVTDEESPRKKSKKK